MAFLSRGTMLRAGAFICVVSLFLSSAVTASEGNALEYAVKASYLYKFAPFVQWPSQAFPAPDSPLTICVAGEDPFGAMLDEAVHRQRVNGRALVVHRMTTIEPGVTCHVLFVGKSAAQSPNEMLLAVAGQPVLTVTDRSRGIGGGMIQFVLVGGRVRFAINMAAAQDSGIQISSKLLGLAVKVER